MSSYVRSVVLSMVLGALLAGCGGGGGGSSSVPPSSGGQQQQQPNPQPTSQPVVTGDPLGISGNTVLLQTLYADAGVTYSSVARLPQSLSPQGSNPNGFAAQIVAGTATIARPNNTTNASTGFLMTYRDANGSCLCNFNGNQSFPNPSAATVSASGWNSGNPYNTVASSTVVLIAFRGPNLPLPVSGPYAYSVPVTGVSASSGLVNVASTLGRQSPPSIVQNISGGVLQSITVSWTPVAGSHEYFLNFLTTHGTGHTHVSGVVITDLSRVTIPASNLYPSTPYQVLLISSDQKWLGVVIDQTTGQASTQQFPALPAQLDWSVAALAQFTTP